MNAPLGRKIIFVLGMLLLYVLRYWSALPAIDPQHAQFYVGSTVNVDGFVAGPAEELGSNVRLRINLQRIYVHGIGFPIMGTVTADASEVQKIQYGDLVNVRGELMALFRPDPRIAGTFKRPAVHLLSRGNGNPFFAFLFNLKSSLEAKLSIVLPHPASAFAAGILLGIQSGIPKDVVMDFRRSGLTHVLALSGFNIIILIQFIESLLSGVPRKIAGGITLAVIACFTLLVGSSASVVRAAVMGSLSVIARLIGRKSIALRALMITGFCMAMIDPFIVIWDIGFQLSFGATAGILLFAKKWQEKFSYLPEVWGARESFITTLAAQVFTFPFLIYYFHSFSIISFISNILVLPFVPILMLGSFLSLFFGIIVAAPTYILFKIVLWLIHWLAAVPFGFIDFGTS